MMNDSLDTLLNSGTLMTPEALLDFHKQRDQKAYFQELSTSFYKAIETQSVTSLLALLKSDPELALHLPQRANQSCVHWLCINPRLAPALMMALQLGAPVDGQNGQDGQTGQTGPVTEPANHLAPGLATGSSSSSSAFSALGGSQITTASEHLATDASSDLLESPLDWAISSGNTLAIEILSTYGAKAKPRHLHHACLHGEGASALTLLKTYGSHVLKPFDPLPLPPLVGGLTRPELSAFEALKIACAKGIDPQTEHRRQLVEAHAYMESLYLEYHLTLFDVSLTPQEVEPFITATVNHTADPLGASDTVFIDSSSGSEDSDGSSASSSSTSSSSSSGRSRKRL